MRAIELGSGVSALPCLVAARLTRRGGRTSKGGEVGAKKGADEEDEDGGGGGGGEAPSSSVPLFSEIFATDIDECLPGLEANVIKNAPAATSVEVVNVKWEEEGAGEGGEEGGEGEAKADEAAAAADGGGQRPAQALKLLDLDWRLFPRAAATASFLRAPFDVVLIADAVYVPELMPALVEAARSVCDARSLVLLAYFLRSERAAARFWPRLRAAFDVEHVPAASFGCAGADKGDAARGLFRLRKRSEGEYRELEERRRRAEEGEEEEEEEEEEEAAAAAEREEEREEGEGNR